MYVWYPNLAEIGIAKKFSVSLYIRDYCLVRHLVISATAYTSQFGTHLCIIIIFLFVHLKSSFYNI